MPKDRHNITDRNPLTVDDARELARVLVVESSMDEHDARALLLLLHAFAFEPEKATRENMLQTVKEAAGFIFPAFDSMMRDELRKGLDALKERGAAK